MTVSWYAARKRFRYKFEIRKVPYQGYCLEPDSSACLTRRAAEAAESVTPPLLRE